MIGLLERYGLQQRARAVIRGFHAATVGRLLILYLLYRQIIVGDRPAFDRRPSADGAAAGRADGGGRRREQQAPLDEERRERVKAYAAATDNVGLFFGEDIFFAIGSIVLIQQTLEAYDIMLSPLELALWAIPTAIAAFMIHGTRLLLLDRSAVTRREGGGP